MMIQISGQHYKRELLVGSVASKFNDKEGEGGREGEGGKGE